MVKKNTEEFFDEVEYEGNFFYVDDFENLDSPRNKMTF